MVRYTAINASVTKRVYPHLFRHSFITHVLAQGMNPVAVQQIVGHSSLAMITRYAHLSPRDAFDALVQYLD